MERWGEAGTGDVSKNLLSKYDCLGTDKERRRTKDEEIHQRE